MDIIGTLRSRYSGSDVRSKEALNNIAISMAMRVANVVANLLVVPLTIGYLNQERYGIWLALSSIIGWVTFLDLGLCNGFRNRFAEAKARGDSALARRYVSTTYAVLSIIVGIALAVILVANGFLDWAGILGVDAAYHDELTFVFAVIIIFTCGNMVANIFCALLNADQKNGYASVIQASGQWLSLLAIYLLSQTTDGSLTNLALYFSGVPCIVTALASVVFFSIGRYKDYRPSLRNIDFSLTRSIMNLGVQFFIIQLCMIAVFQIVNVVISRELGPVAVTHYNIANKYFNVICMTATIIVTPMWSAFTDAYTLRDYKWMRTTYRRLMQLVALSVLAFVLLAAVADVVYRYWVGADVVIPSEVTFSMAVMVFIQTYCTVNLYVVNGIGAVRIQTIIYMVFALVSWYLLTACCQWGLVGVTLFVSLVYLTLGVFGQIQIHKILNNTAKGIWLR